VKKSPLSKLAQVLIQAAERIKEASSDPDVHLVVYERCRKLRRELLDTVAWMGQQRLKKGVR